jgi:mannose/cellobiose epimerase-like protein (N-acyl-D-glucosamine 2-epimerase family)
MVPLNVMPVQLESLKSTSQQYREYCERRIEFLLKRRRSFVDFPGVQTGYNSITGAEFQKSDILSYSWINGRGACVFARFSRYFPGLAAELRAYAEAVIGTLERHWELNHHSYPFLVNLDGTEKAVGRPKPAGYKSYSDLYAGMGFLEYGATFSDTKRIRTAKDIFEQTIKALGSNRFVTEPDDTPPDRVLENPWSVALDLANEFAKQLNDPSYLDVAAELIAHLLDRYYRPDTGAFVEYVTPEGKPFLDENGIETVDPGHAIEFCCFALEFSRLAEIDGRHAALRARVNDVAPRTIRWNIANGWNSAHPGIYKTIDPRSRRPINETMPWWILPETILALLLAHERTHDSSFLQSFKIVHDTYFSTYMNPRTEWGPFQNLDGRTGTPIDIVPACKFQDPEFHSGKNLLTASEVIHRIL